ncbi:UDP-glycosyltransferase UGT5-like [Aedes albopictus]|uniref:UDP-glucuronosyltransferase n=1 Tax=Aedes albopictus TaxID=7160 RepID=A0ABM2A7J8_AEDAL|nr:UDP-glucuronosyltransferase 2B1-like [Aedes albopictus]
MAARLAVAAVLLYLVTFSEGAKILGVLPMGAKSHFNIGSGFMKTLAEAGHDVTVISPFPLKNAPKNYRTIELTGLLEDGRFNQNMFELKSDGGIVAPLIMLIMMYESFAPMICKFILGHENVVKLLNSDEKFDLVFAETFISESLYGFAQHFDAPLIAYSTFGSSMWTNDLVGTPAPPSHVANYLLSYTDKMTFWQRFHNTAMYLFDRLYYEWRYLPSQKRMYDEGFPNAKMTFEQQMKNVSLVFLNQHFSLSSPRPYPPNMIEAGGIQIEDAKPLPADLQKYLDEAKDGVIYFCMGSNIKSIHFPEEKRNAFLRVFSKLKQRVLWKFEDETMPNQPPNLMIKAWMPQNDILAHPNVKLFITHGGLLGMTEALYHGKPLVGIPIFGDQPMNVQKAVRSGYGVLLDYDNINEQTVETALRTVLNDPSYTRNVKEVSDRFRDKPMTPKETAVFWTEYVIRHRGAPHLRSPALDLSLFQYELLDVYAVMLVLLIGVIAVDIYIAKKILRKVCRKMCSGGQKKKKQH